MKIDDPGYGEIRNACKPYIDQGQVDDTFDRGEIISMACTAEILKTLREIRETIQQMIGGKRK